MSDVPIQDLLTLAIIGRRIDPHRIRNIVLPGSTGTAGGASVVFLDARAEQIFSKVRQFGAL